MPELEIQPTVRVKFWHDGELNNAILTKGKRQVCVECDPTLENGVEFAMRLAHLLEQMPEELFPGESE